MAKRAQQTTTSTDKGPRLYVVLQRTSPTELKQLGVVKARNADRARDLFLDFDPKTLIGIPALRWNENEGMCLRNKPERDAGQAVPVLDGQMAIEAA